METVLHYQDDRSDKVYVVSIEPAPGVSDRWNVFASYGRRGGALKKDQKGDTMRFDEAEGLRDKLVREKVHHRSTPYRIVTDEPAPKVQAPVEQKAGVDSWQDTELPSHMLLNEIDVRRAAELLEDDDWLLQPKYDGVRCRLGKADGSGQVGAVSRTGKPVALPAGVVEYMATRFAKTVVLDGELVGDTYVVFDVLKEGGNHVWEQPADYRVGYLQTMFGRSLTKMVVATTVPVVPTVCARTREEKAKLYRALVTMGMEGAVFKHKHAEYVAGRPNNPDFGKALKYKFVSTASLISGGQRKVVSERTGDLKRSITLHLYDKNAPNFCGEEVGSCTIPPNKAIPGRGEIGEYRYLYRHDVGGDLVQAVYLGPRTDVRPEDCTAAQLRVKGRPKE